MLNFKSFDISDDLIIYEGNQMYSITPAGDGSLTVLVEDLDENGELTKSEPYAASSLSTALAIIERLEAGELE